MLSYKTVNIQSDLHKRLKMKALEKGVTISALINDHLSKVLPGKETIAPVIPEVTAPAITKVKDSPVKQRGELDSEDYIS
jgi:hypothetical protein